MKKIINHGIGLPLSDSENLQEQSSNNEEANGKDKPSGDTPLHIAARNKCLQIVKFLLKVPEVDKYAVNLSGLTPLAIAKENTEYYEVYEIIEKLSDYPKGQRPFMYNAPSQSREKLKNGIKFVDDIYYKRQNVEIVVAALLATMTFTAVFQVPGGFEKETKDGRVIATPTLINSTSFKLFMGFDVLAFFLSLFVVYVWQVRPELTTREKMLVMRRNNQLLCTAFVFTAFGLIAALYVVLGQKLKIFSWGVIAMIFIVILVCLATYYLTIRFAIRGARFSRLCGVFFIEDDIVEKIWLISEKMLFNYLHWRRKRLQNFFPHRLPRNGLPETSMRCLGGNRAESPLNESGYSSTHALFSGSPSSV